ncbi:hypothetical protein ACFQY5_13045 [Paeniroseomonas aquatica]|uniref:hypothetical protein n=1 Tax=Paeniroseomonas aquatica TaxID=373043 RepID=UPI0036142F93
MREHENEPIWGLPEQLPAGERILWQGRPDWRALTRRALHLPLLAGYFALLLATHAVAALLEGTAPAVAAWNALWFTPSRWPPWPWCWPSAGSRRAAPPIPSPTAGW